MKKKNIIKIIVISGMLNLILCCSDTGNPSGDGSFIRSNGYLLETPDGEQFLIKGIAFGNHVWGNPSSTDWFTHHSPVDYERVKSMGFNCIRFYINYGLFENDADPYVYKDEGFEWLDKNIAAARKNGIYLLLNMHYPQGGFQSNGDGDALWTDRNNQLRLIELWKEIARHYKDEEFIIGYGLVNEPVPLSGVEQWGVLAQELIDAIRQVDPYHLLFVERANWLKTGATQAEQDNLFFPVNINDPGPRNGIVFEYHMYLPMPFTHQNADWLSSYIGKYTVWPDNDRLEVINPVWETFLGSGPGASSGTSGWTTLSGNLYQVNNAEYKIGRPVIQAHSIGTGGKIWADDITIEEYDSTGSYIRTICDSPVDSDDGWYFWSNNGSGNGALVSEVSGASNNKCLCISGTTDDANFGNDSFRFIITQGNKYKISGRVKGENVADGATVVFRIDLYSCDEVHTWNRDYLDSLIGSYIRFSNDKNIPLYLGEFGTIRDSFFNNRGGLIWVEDMLNILTSGNVNYNYHTYHERSFGLYMNGAEELPDPEAVNTGLVDLFKYHQL